MGRYLRFALLLCCSGCALLKPSDHFGAREISFSDLSGWQQDNYAEALAVFIQSCPILATKAQPASSGSGIIITEHVWQSLCSDAMRIPQGDEERARAFFERRFVPYRVTNNDREQGLFTGY